MSDIVILQQVAYKVANYYIKKNTCRGMDSVGVQFLGDKILSIVQQHANNVSMAGLANAIPGAGPMLAIGGIIASTWNMYYDINNCIGVSFSENFLKSIASGIASNLAGNAVGVAGTAGANLLSWIPVVGNVAAAVGGVAANRASLYAAALAYLKILASVAENGSALTESSFKAALNGNLRKNQQYNRVSSKPVGNSSSNGYLRNSQQYNRVSSKPVGNSSSNGYLRNSQQYNRVSSKPVGNTSSNGYLRNNQQYDRVSSKPIRTDSNAAWNEAIKKAINLLYLFEYSEFEERETSLNVIESITITGEKELAWKQIKQIWRTFATDLEINTKILPNPDGIKYNHRPFPIRGYIGVQGLINEIAQNV